MKATPDILQRILAAKAAEVTAHSEAKPLRELRAELDGLPPPRGFLASLERVASSGRAAVIAEIKKASPSQGVLRPDYHVEAIARGYAAAGAACLSVLTDKEFFQGEARHLKQARSACALPVLRKDFVVDPWQVYESRVMGADGILLIVAALGDAMLADLAALAADLELDVLLEVHDAVELERALALQPPCIGINNRDLHTFQVDTGITLSLLPHIPQGCLVVTESGIRTKEDVARLREQGVQGFLVGEAFMRAEEPGQRLAELFTD